MPAARIRIAVEDTLAQVRPELYGIFTEHLGQGIYGGIWVGEESPIRNIDGLRRDVIEVLRRIGPATVRWPGGCFADEYHWENGIGPRAERPRTVNFSWGNEIEANAFGTHEFMRFCRLLGAEPLISGNAGMGDPAEMQRWVEYCNFPAGSTLAERRAANGSPEPFRVRYWGVGNEAWGCGGHLAPEDYAMEYMRFSSFLPDIPGAPLYLIAVGPSRNDADWTRRFFTKLQGHSRIHGFSAHYYLDDQAGPQDDYGVERWCRLFGRVQAMEDLIKQHRAIMDGFDPQRRIGLTLDEWGTWHPLRESSEPQDLWQDNTLRDALAAASILDLFHRRADEVAMANLAQAVNMGQMLIHTEGERMLITPTYHVFSMYLPHRGAATVRAVFEAADIPFTDEGQERRVPGLTGSASLKGKDLTLSVVNPHVSAAQETAIELTGAEFGEVECTVLSHSDIRAQNTFDAPETLKPYPAPVTWVRNSIRHVFPPASVTVFTARLS